MGAYLFFGAKMLSEREILEINQLASGIRSPKNGMEKHFLRVIAGEAIPCSSKEENWLRYWVESKNLDINNEGDERFLAKDKIEFLENKVLQLEKIISQKDQIIIQLKKEVTQLTQLAENSHKDTKDKKKQETNIASFSICKICDGDGGAKGECYKCGGTGWVND
jgi:hypothetical protein